MTTPSSAHEFVIDRESTDDIWQAMFTQRAIRYWQAKKVPRPLLARVIEAASKAPSGSNLQPWIFVVVDDDGRRNAISEALRFVYQTTEPLQKIIAAGERSEDKSQRLMLKGARALFSQLEKAPALIVPCLYRLASPVGDASTLLAGSSIYLAVQNLLLAARALGLGTVMTTVHTMIADKLRDILALPEDATPVALIPIGFPAANFGPTVRKGVDEILRWNRWQ